MTSIEDTLILVESAKKQLRAEHNLPAIGVDDTFDNCCGTLFNTILSDFRKNDAKAKMNSADDACFYFTVSKWALAKVAYRFNSSFLRALADTEDEMRHAPYRVLRDWQQLYDGNLLVVLPDAFGTASFLRDAPDWVADWKGFRPDSADPVEGGEEIIAWWKAKGQDPRDKLIVFSDGLDVEEIERVYTHFRGRVHMSFGWGTNLTNDMGHIKALYPNHKVLGCLAYADSRVQVNFDPAVYEALVGLREEYWLTVRHKRAADSRPLHKRMKVSGENRALRFTSTL